MDLMQKKGVDTSGIQRVVQPTRAVYVTRDADGDREFAGFGMPSEEYCDCFISPDHLPEGMLKGAKVRNAHQWQRRRLRPQQLEQQFMAWSRVA